MRLPMALLREALKNTSESIKIPLEKIESAVDFVKKRPADWPDTWFLVFDNYDDPSAFNLLDFVPQGDSGRILVTSRNVGTLIDSECMIHLEGLLKRMLWTIC